MAFQLDLAGGAEVLKVLAADAVKNLADQIAAEAGEGATVETYVTDRAVAAVRVPADAQAKDGVLTKAAAAVGLPVVAKPPRKARPRKASPRKSTSAKPQARKGAAK